MKVSSVAKADRIAAIVVNYGTVDLTIAAVESLLVRQHGGQELHIHLVDNASPGGDAIKLKAAADSAGWKGRVTFWPETENHGFGRGNNVVLQALAVQDSPPDKVFLLNPDARLHNEAVDILAEALDADPRAGAAGAALLRPDLTPATAAFRFPSPISELTRVIGLGALDRLTARYQVALPPDHPAGPVDWVSGASVMFRFDAIAPLGFFDPGFFLYYEEVDLMRRLRDNGWRVLFEPSAQVLHAEGAATGQFASRKARHRDPWYLYQSWAHYFSRAFGHHRALIIALGMWPAACLNILHRCLRGRRPTLPRRFFADHWKHVIWPLLQRQRKTVCPPDLKPCSPGKSR